MFNISKTSIMVRFRFQPLKTIVKGGPVWNITSWLGNTGRGWNEYSLSQTKTIWKSANGLYPGNPLLVEANTHTQSREVVQDDSAHHLWVSGPCTGLPQIFVSYLFWLGPENSFLFGRRACAKSTPHQSDRHWISHNDVVLWLCLHESPED